MTDKASVAHSLLGGVAASVVALLAFLLIHHVWIRPIWFVAPAGLPIALLGGLAVGWSFFHVHSGLPTGAWTSPATLGMILLLLLPATLLSFTHGPLFDIATAQVPTGQGRRVAVHFLLELVTTAMTSGAVVGWWLGRTGAAALATSLAGLAYAIGPGHNIPLFGRHPLQAKDLTIVVAVSAVAAFVLVEVTRRVSGR